MTTYVYIIRVDAVGQERLEALLNNAETKPHVKQVICAVPEYTTGSSGASGDANSLPLGKWCKCSNFDFCKIHGCMMESKRGASDGKA